MLLATVLGSGMASLDATVVNIALPAIGRDLDATLAGLQWTLNGYTLTLAAFILLGGSLGDVWGRRRIFLIGAVAFASDVAAVRAGAARSSVLVGARMLQGVAGALLTPGSLAIIAASFHPDDRAAAIGAWSGLGGCAAAVGPFVGGYLIEHLSWRWIFLINLPLALAVVLVARRHVPESSDPDAPRQTDVAGAFTCVLALAALTFGLIRWGADGFSALVLLALLVAVACRRRVRRGRAAQLAPDGAAGHLPLDPVHRSQHRHPRRCTPPWPECSSCSPCSCRSWRASHRSPPARPCCPVTALMLLGLGPGGPAGPAVRAASVHDRRATGLRRRDAAAAPGRRGARATGWTSLPAIAVFGVGLTTHRVPADQRGPHLRPAAALRGRVRGQQRGRPHRRAALGRRAAAGRRDRRGQLPGARRVRRRLRAGAARVRGAAGPRRRAVGAADRPRGCRRCPSEATEPQDRPAERYHCGVDAPALADHRSAD